MLFEYVRQPCRAYIATTSAQNCQCSETSETEFDVRVDTFHSIAWEYQGCEYNTTRSLFIITGIILAHNLIVLGEVGLLDSSPVKLTIPSYTITRKRASKSTEADLGAPLYRINYKGLN